MSSKRMLTQDDAELIRDSHDEYLRMKYEANKLSTKALAVKFGISEVSIRDILMHRTYK